MRRGAPRRGARAYRAGADRAFLYKRVQELYMKNTAQLASDIFEDRLGVDPANLPERPGMGAIEELYGGLFSAESPPDDHPITDGRASEFKIMRPITEEEVSRAIMTTTSNASGPDGIKLSSVRKTPSYKLVLLYNIMLAFQAVPLSMKRARTTLIPKGGISADPSKWRPITITSVLLRLLNKILAWRLSDLPIHPHQRGFKRIDGCLINNLGLQSTIRECRDSVRSHVVVTLDLRKAFDSVSHGAMRRAMRRLGLEGEFIDYVLDSYAGATTVVSCMGEATKPIELRRGVRQGDPLSPILFNLVLDELLCLLEGTGKGLLCRDGTRMACMGYADDLVILSDTVRNAQSLLNTTGRFMRERGLDINVEKCTALVNSVVPGRKKLMIPSTTSLCVSGLRIPAVKPEDRYKYLGFQYGMSGVDSAISVRDIGKYLGLLQRAPLKPQQKFRILKQFLIPKYLFSLQNPKITLSLLHRMDKQIRKFVKKALHIHITCPDAFLYAAARDGGLGVPCLVTMIPGILARRMDAICRSHDPSVLRIAVSATFQKLRTKLERWTRGCGQTGAQTRRHFATALESSYSGGGLRQGSHGSHSSFWVDYPPRYWNGRDYCRAVQLKGNALPTVGIPSNPPEKKKCRAGCQRVETLCHVLQKCPVAHWKRIERHDRVAEILARGARRRGFVVESEPRVRTSGGLLKPDLIITKDESVIVCDVGVHWEGPASLRVAYEDKVRHYSSAPFVEAVKKMYGEGKRIAVLPFIVGARGVLCDLNRSIISAIGLSAGEVRDTVLSVLRGGSIIHADFMKLVWAHV